MRRRNRDFTTDEAQTATLIITEGTFDCQRVPMDKTYTYPRIDVRMCVKEALEPASRVFGTRVSTSRERTVTCPPELFPPDGKGIWRVASAGRPARQVMEKLKPLIPRYYWQKWQDTLRRCEAERPPTKRYRPRRRRTQ